MCNVSNFFVMDLVTCQHFLSDCFFNSEENLCFYQMNRNYQHAYGWAHGNNHLTMLMIFWCLVVCRCDATFHGHCWINFMKRGNNAHFSTFNICSWIIIVIIQLFTQMHLLDESRQPYLYWMVFLRYCYFWYTLCMYFVYYWINPNGLYMHVWLVFSV